VWLIFSISKIDNLAPDKNTAVSIYKDDKKDKKYNTTDPSV
jgi:hypothetical protein